MKNDNEIFESLIAGGLVGAALGVLVSGKKEGATLGAIAGATILATYKASQQAMQTNLPNWEQAINLITAHHSAQYLPVP